MSTSQEKMLSELFKRVGSLEQQRDLDREKINRMEEQADLDREQRDLDRETINRMEEQADLDREQRDLDREKINRMEEHLNAIVDYTIKTSVWMEQMHNKYNALRGETTVGELATSLEANIVAFYNETYNQFKSKGATRLSHITKIMAKEDFQATNMEEAPLSLVKTLEEFFKNKRKKRNTQNHSILPNYSDTLNDLWTELQTNIPSDALEPQQVKLCCNVKNDMGARTKYSPTTPLPTMPSCVQNLISPSRLF